PISLPFPDPCPSPLGVLFSISRPTTPTVKAIRPPSRGARTVDRSLTRTSVRSFGGAHQRGRCGGGDTAQVQAVPAAWLGRVPRPRRLPDRAVDPIGPAGRGLGWPAALRGVRRAGCRAEHERAVGGRDLTPPSVLWRRPEQQNAPAETGADLRFQRG